jgi:hypothetical protein
MVLKVIARIMMNNISINGIRVKIYILRKIKYCLLSVLGVFSFFFFYLKNCFVVFLKKKCFYECFIFEFLDNIFVLRKEKNKNFNKLRRISSTCIRLSFYFSLCSRRKQLKKNKRKTFVC